MKRSKIDNLPGLGTRLAAVGIVVSVATSLNAGCLVTDKIEFDEENVPAIVTRTEQPRVFSRLKSEGDQLCMGDVGSSTVAMAFVVNVADANIDDQLDVRAIVNGQWVASATVPPGTFNRGSQLLCVRNSALTSECNYVVIGVSRSFANNDSDPLTPREDDDLGTVDFWVLGRADDLPNATPEHCFELINPDGGLL